MFFFRCQKQNSKKNNKKLHSQIFCRIITIFFTVKELKQLDGRFKLSNGQRTFLKDVLLETCSCVHLVRDCKKLWVVIDSVRKIFYRGDFNTTFENELVMEWFCCDIRQGLKLYLVEDFQIHTFNSRLFSCKKNRLYQIISVF